MQYMHSTEYIHQLYLSHSLVCLSHTKTLGFALCPHWVRVCMAPLPLALRKTQPVCPKQTLDESWNVLRFTSAKTVTSRLTLALHC
jgi:hypothetical protein